MLKFGDRAVIAAVLEVLRLNGQQSPYTYRSYIGVRKTAHVRF